MGVEFRKKDSNDSTGGWTEQEGRDKEVGSEVEWKKNNSAKKLKLLWDMRRQNCKSSVSERDKGCKSCPSNELL